MQNPRSLLEGRFERNSDRSIITEEKRWIVDCSDFVGQFYQSPSWYTFITCSPTYLYILGSRVINHEISQQEIMVSLLADIDFNSRIIKINQETEESGFTYILLEFDEFTLPLIKDIELSFGRNNNNRKKTVQKSPLLPSFYTKDMRVQGTLTIPDVDAEFR